jgi:hypothetical protein
MIAACAVLVAIAPTLAERSARFTRGCLLRSLKAISYFQAITRARDARAFF